MPSEHSWAPPLDPHAVDEGGRPVTHREYSLDEYVRMVEEKQGRAVSPEQREVLRLGCVGVVLDRLGSPAGMPIMRIAFGDVAAHREIAELEKLLAPVEVANRDVMNCQQVLTEAEGLMRKYGTAWGFRDAFGIERGAQEHLEWCKSLVEEARRRAEETMSHVSREHNVLEMMNAKNDAKIEGNKRVFTKVLHYASELNKIFATRPAGYGDVMRLVEAHPALRPLQDGMLVSLPNSGTPEGWEAVIIYKDLWSGRGETASDTTKVGNPGDTSAGTETPDPARFAPDPETGRVDMSKDLNRGRPGSMNFNYAWYDPETNSWWGADRGDVNPEFPMRVKQMTDERLFAYSLDYDSSVFSIQIINKSTPKP